MEQIKSKKNLIVSIILVIVLAFVSFISLPLLTANAIVYNNSDVLDDLNRDVNFKESDYPSLSLNKIHELNNDRDPTNNVEYISVIQIAESDSNELFIYTYQPLNLSHDLTAVRIKISFGYESKNYVNKYLKCVSSNGVFKKYLVNDYTLSNEVERFYNILEIERPFNIAIDEKISDETNIKYKSHPVAQTWCCYFEKSELNYEMGTLEYADIDVKLVDFLHVENGFTLGSLIGIEGEKNVHYVAFEIENYAVDSIINGYLEYDYRSFYAETCFKEGLVPLIFEIFGAEFNETTVVRFLDDEKPCEEPIVLNEKDVCDVSGRGLWGKKYSWNRIMPASDFISESEKQGCVFDENVKTKLKEAQFVFVFLETDSTTIIDNIDVFRDGILIYDRKLHTFGTYVCAVDIFRLEFWAKGNKYDLGVVGDTVYGDNKAGGVLVNDWDENFKLLAKLILLLVLLVILWPIISPFLGLIIKLVFKGFLIIIKIVWKIITFPFRLIKPKRRE